MLKIFKSQKGAIAPILVTLLLLAGLGVGYYLTSKPTNLKPKADEIKVQYRLELYPDKVVNLSASDKEQLLMVSLLDSKGGLAKDKDLTYNWQISNPALAEIRSEEYCDQKVADLYDKLYSKSPPKDPKKFDAWYKQLQIKTDKFEQKNVCQAIVAYVKPLSTGSGQITVSVTKGTKVYSTAVYTINIIGSVPSPTPPDLTVKPDLKVTGIESATRNTIWVNLCHSGSTINAPYNLKITNKDGNFTRTIDDIGGNLTANQCSFSELYCIGDCFPGKATSVNMEVEIDPSNAINESDETNNKYSTTLQKPAKWQEGCGNC